MAENTKIQWTNHTFSPWIGCTKVSPGCANCYAEEMMDHRFGRAKWGPGGTRSVTSEESWRKPAAWNRAAAKAGVRKKVFCSPTADVFEGPDTMPDAAWDAVTVARKRLGQLILDTPHLDWLLLTKRPANVLDIARDMWARFVREAPLPSNVWIGASVEDQQRAEERIPELLKVPAAIRFLSVEPLLGPVDLSRWLVCEWYAAAEKVTNTIPPTTYRPARLRPRIDWVIVGGESGPHARPCRIEWVRDIVRQCKAAGVPVFVKQLGAEIEARDGIDPIDQFPGKVRFRQGRDEFSARINLIDPKGGDPEEWPAELRVREFPAVGA